MNEDGKPKFDTVVGNPPYQTEIATKPGQEQPTVTNVFHEFQFSAMFIAQKTSLVYPGGRWIQQSGKGVKKFGKDFINDPRLVSVDLYGNGDETPNDKKLFGVRIHDGVSIVYWNSQHDNPSTLKFNGIEVERPGDEILPVESSALSILNKIRSTSSLSNRGFSLKLYSIESSFVEENPSLVVPIEQNSPFENTIKLFSNDRAGKGGTPKWYWTSLDNIKTNVEMVNRHQVTVSSASPNSTIFTRIPAGAAHGRSRLSLADFETSEEADNFESYIFTPFCRFLFDLTKHGGLSKLAFYVPDIGDYTSSNPIFTPDAELPDNHEYKNVSLNERLYLFFNLSKDEIATIERF